MKCVILLITVAIVLISCKQSTKSIQNIVDTENLHSTEKAQTQSQYEKYIDTKYKYAYSQGGSITIENSLPKGEGYTDPNGKEYFKIIFWSRIINETSKPFELKIDFPANSYQLPSSPDKHYKILLPSDTLILNRADLINYGETELKSFLDNSIDKPSSLRRTINSGESSGFYVVILFDAGISGPYRTGLSIRGQNLFYRISTPANSGEAKEIYCGNINLINLVLQK